MSTWALPALAGPVSSAMGIPAHPGAPARRAPPGFPLPAPPRLAAGAGSGNPGGARRAGAPGWAGMPIALLTGPANAGKAQVLMDGVRGHLAHGEEPLLVVPTRVDAEHYLRELAGDGAA